jgi:protocatechuate 3,4-dioxygenase beta subunit
MERKNFLKSLLVGSVSSSVLLQACKKDADVTATSTSGTTTGTTTGTSGSCSVIQTETEGPYPTKAPASYVRSDITDGRSGYKMTVSIAITNYNDNCNAVANALVDIWHCDAEGNYSEYGGSGSQINKLPVGTLFTRQANNQFCWRGNLYQHFPGLVHWPCHTYTCAHL